MTSAPFESIVRPPKLADKVFQQLAVMLRGEPGREVTLPAERELALKLGVSRNVLREATKRLELQGLLEIRQGQGARAVDRLHKPISASLELLVPIEKERMRQLFQVRWMIEPHNAHWAAGRANHSEMKRIEAAHHSLLSATTAPALVAADMEFHRAIADASGNQIARLLLESLAELREMSHAKGYRGRPSERTKDEHLEIVTAILTQQSDAARMAMEKHLISSSEDLGFSVQDISE
jgi:GntR family transcriptional repressor for pyruvate dehydrogenase complex